MTSPDAPHDTARDMLAESSTSSAVLVLGYLIGLITGAAFTIIFVRAGIMWGAR